jgi:hypothetical protein
LAMVSLSSSACMSICLVPDQLAYACGPFHPAAGRQTARSGGL